jgi:hypothetical protein
VVGKLTFLWIFVVSHSKQNRTHNEKIFNKCTKNQSNLKGLQAAGHNVSAAAIIQLKVSSLIRINWHVHIAQYALILKGNFIS